MRVVTRQLGLATVVFLGLAGCSSKSAAPDSPPAAVTTLPSLPAYQPPPGSLDFYTPIFTVPAGSDTTWCTFTDTILADETLIHTTDGVQTPFGHHAIIFYTPKPEQVGKTVECSSADMDRFRQMMGGTGGEGTNFWKPPANIATRLPKGAQFVVQTHWINTTNQPQQVQAHVAAVPMKMAADTVIGGSVAIVNTQFSIDAHTKASSSTSCMFDQDHKFMISVPHEHEWGSHLITTVTRKNGTVDTIFDTPFQKEWTSHPKINDYGIDHPFLVSAGDRIDLTCEWDNTTSDALQFPREMCVMFAFSLEDEDSHCVDGVWSNAKGGDPTGGGGSTGAGGSSGGPPATSCVQPGDKGNSIGVGTPCTPGGGECKAYPKAGACLADLGQDIWMCTRIGCKVDTDCGETAVCHHDPAGSACVPSRCDGGSGGAAGSGG